MAIQTDTTDRSTTGIRVALSVGGILAVIVGVLILAWPSKTATVITVLVATYAVAAGVVYIGLGMGSKTKGGWARVGHVILGFVFIIAGIVAFFYLGATTAVLAFLLGILVGMMWIIEGIVSLSTIADASSRGWTIFFAVLSILAGIVLLFAPSWGIVVLFTLLGISLIVLGIIQIVRAIVYGRGDNDDVKMKESLA